MFECFGGERFWPLTADVGVLAAPLDTVVTALETTPPKKLWRKAPPGWPRYDDLAAAIAATPEHATFYVGTGDGRTAVIATVTLDHFWLLGRGQHDLDCDLVWTTFVPAGTGIEPAARFGDYRRGGPDVAFTVDALRFETSGWYFDRLGPDRPYEEPAFYTRRARADRLPFALLKRYASAAGLPVDDPGFLTGPVAVHRRDAARGWTTIADLRAGSGYPPDGVVTTLTTRRPETERPEDRPPTDLPITRLTEPGALPVWTVDVEDTWPALVRLTAELEGWVPVLLAGDAGTIGQDCPALDADHVRQPLPGPGDELAALSTAGLGRVDPGLATGGPELPWPQTGPAGTLCLVPAADPADVLATLGWEGPANVMTMAELTVLLRRWSRLFGATLVAADPEGSSLDLVLTRPPVDLTELELCCDQLTRHPGEGAPLVNLWWD